MKYIYKIIFLFLVTNIIACVSTTPEGTIIREEKKEEFNDVKIIQNWSGVFPVDKLNVLPKGQELLPAGYIGDADTFKNVWEIFSPGTPVPEVDFDANMVVFGKNTQYFNRTTIFKVTLSNEGVAEILAMATMSAIPIEDKVAMSMAIISREGIKTIFTAGRQLPVE